MDNPKVAMIGAGAMGGVIAGALLRAGTDLTIIDTDAAHVAAINAHGLKVANLGDGAALPARAMTEPEGEGWADLAVVMTPAYETANAAKTAARVLKPEAGVASMQNGLGNAEALTEVLGPARVFMGSTRVSADRPAPGCPRATRIDPSAVGELSGPAQARTRWLAETLTKGGLPTTVSDNVEGVMWSKFIHNCAINALSATTGLTMGEVTRTPGLGDLRWEIVAEGMAVARARGITLEPDPEPKLRPHVWRKFTKPSMQQHVEQGRPIEIDAINGWLVAEGERLDIPTPVNRVVAALARGRALASERAQHRPVDHAAWMAAADEMLATDPDAWRDPALPPVPYL